MRACRTNRPSPARGPGLGSHLTEQCSANDPHTPGARLTSLRGPRSGSRAWDGGVVKGKGWDGVWCDEGLGWRCGEDSRPRSMAEGRAAPPQRADRRIQPGRQSGRAAGGPAWPAHCHERWLGPAGCRAVAATVTPALPNIAYQSNGVRYILRTSLPCPPRYDRRAGRRQNLPRKRPGKQGQATYKGRPLTA